MGKKILLALSLLLLSLMFVLFILHFRMELKLLVKSCKTPNDETGKCVFRELCNNSNYDIDIRISDSNDVCGSDINVICCHEQLTSSIENDNSLLNDTYKTQSEDSIITQINSDADKVIFSNKNDDDSINKSISRFILKMSNRTLLRNSEEYEVKAKLLNEKACGRAYSNRVLGGDEAAPGEFPFMVALKFGNEPSKNLKPAVDYKCGASLITGFFRVKLP